MFTRNTTFGKPVDNPLYTNWIELFTRICRKAPDCKLNLITSRPALYVDLRHSSVVAVMSAITDEGYSWVPHPVDADTLHGIIPAFFTRDDGWAVSFTQLPGASYLVFVIEQVPDTGLQQSITIHNLRAALEVRAVDPTCENIVVDVGGTHDLMEVLRVIDLVFPDSTWSTNRCVDSVSSLNVYDADGIGIATVSNKCDV